MEKIDIKSEIILIVGRLAMAKMGYDSNPKIFVLSALAGAVIALKCKSKEVGHHVDGHAPRLWNRIENPQWLVVLMGMTEYIIHFDHHAFDSYPVKSVVFGYLTGSSVIGLWKEPS